MKDLDIAELTKLPALVSPNRIIGINFGAGRRGNRAARDRRCSRIRPGDR